MGLAQRTVLSCNYTICYLSGSVTAKKHEGVSEAHFYPSPEGWEPAETWKNKTMCKKQNQGGLPRVLCLISLQKIHCLLQLSFFPVLPSPFKIEALKSFSKSDLVNWFKAHRGPGSKMLSVHVSMVA